MVSDLTRYRGYHRAWSVLAAVGIYASLGADAVAQGSVTTDREALVALYNATGGEAWTNSTNWKTAAPMREWYGVRTGAGGRVTTLDLRKNALIGPIPDALGTLSDLDWLVLDNNALRGLIPEALGNLSNLESLWLRSNALTGRIPEALGNLSNLTELYLNNNPLTGPLPFELTRLSRLTRLEIKNTGLCAPADSAFQEWLAPIDFSGSTCRNNRSPEPVAMIPAQTLTAGGAALGVSVAGYFRDPDDDPLSYEAASSDGARATVSVSSSVVWLAPGQAGTATVTVTARDPGGLSATRTMAVTVVVSSGPQSDYEVLAALYGATGGPTWTDSTNWKTDAPLGEWYGVTTDAGGRVTGLDLRENALIGPIPDALGGLSDLDWLVLNNNALTGPIPESLGNLSNLRVLDLRKNALIGPIPDALGGLSGLDWLVLNNNALTGPIPESLGNLSNLRVLDLRKNALIGPIPDALGGLSGLDWLVLNNNALTGPIPESLGNLSNLTELSLSYNWGVSGELPDGLRLPRLRELDIGVTQVCAPVSWSAWVRTIDFFGVLCEVEAAVTVDVAVVYTPAAREAAGGTAAIEAVIDLMIGETNQAYAASGVRHNIALVARSEVLYAETGDSFIDIARLRDPSDGHMDEAHALREASGADLVHLLFDEGNVGGIADIGGAFGLSCQKCGGRVFAHETGHNMGLRHDRYEIDNSNGTLLPHPAYGYVNQRTFGESAPPSSRWRTIMSYETQCADAYKSCPGLLRFSNPRRSWLGDPLGVAYEAGAFGVGGPADAATVLNSMGPAVAAWRDRPPPGTEAFSISDRGGQSITSSGTEETVRVGYGEIRAAAGSTTPSGIAIFQFRNSDGVLISEAGVPAARPVREGRIFAEVDGPFNTGMAIANPNDGPAFIQFYFTDTNGTRFAEGNFELGAHQQTAKFLDQAPFNGGSSVLGTLTFTSSLPVAVVALRGFTNEAGEFLMTTLPVAPLRSPPSLFSQPADAVYFPHFADGSGWATQVILVNPTDRSITGTVAFLGQGSDTAAAAPVVLTLDDGSKGSNFDYSIAPRSAQRFTTSNPSGGVSVGSVRATPHSGNDVPSGLVVFSYTQDGKTVSEAGVPALPKGSAFRVYVEASGMAGQTGSIRSGLAIANTGDTTNTVTLEVTRLDGSLAVPPDTLALPPSGQIARFLDEIFTLPGNFAGVVQVTSTAEVAIVGLRLRVNGRGELKVTTTPPSDETGPSTTAEMFFPHIVDSGGWSTQFILFSGTAGQAASGTLRFIDASGQPLDLPITQP